MTTKILVVRDEPGGPNEWQELLPSPSFTVATCLAGSKALATAQDLGPDLIVVDVSRADGASISIARTLGWVHRVPLIFVTPTPGAAFIERVRDIPLVAAVLGRSCARERLLDAVTSALCEMRQPA